MAAADAFEDSGAIVDVQLVKQWLLWGIIWTVIFPLVGLVVSLKFNFPEFLGHTPWLTWGRMRPMHVNGAIWGSFSTTFFGLVFYMVPKLTGIRMVGEKLGYLCLWLWNIGVICGSYSLMAGQQKGVELADYALWADVPLILAFFLLTYMVIATIVKRKEKLLYISLYYTAGAMLWNAVNFPLGNILLPYRVLGVNNAALHGLYAHNIVGLWITPAALALAYYFLPLAVKNPLYSHKLALIGFWSLALFYPFVGIRHYLYSPIPNWAQTVAIVASMMVIVPVWTVTQNFFGTMMGNWRALQESIVAKFLILGAICYLLGCFQWSTQAIRGMQQLTHFTDYAVAHSHLTIFGAFVIWATSGMYYVWPRVTGHALWSRRLATWHFWLIAASLAVMAGVLTVMGLVQGTMWTDSVEFVDTVVTMKPYWLIRTLSGVGMLIAILLFTINMLMTALEPSLPPELGREKGFAPASD
jgi:cytochrome c oxidase cbb3-type subunit I